MPMSGATTMNTSVLTQPWAMIAPKPALATAAPAYPPTNACEEDVGSPSHQVARSQMIAPSSPPRITVASTSVRSIIPPPIVFAMAVPNTNAATKFQNAAQMTAAVGESTRVETTVAMEFAAS